MNYISSLYVLGFGIGGVFSRWIIDIIFFRFGLANWASTLTINAIGSLAAGGLYVMLIERGYGSQALKTGALVGFTAAFTTFSTYCLQAFLSIEQGHWLHGVLYLVLSPILGVTAVAIGIYTTRLLP